VYIAIIVESRIWGAGVSVTTVDTIDRSEKVRFKTKFKSSKNNQTSKYTEEKIQLESGNRYGDDTQKAWVAKEDVAHTEQQEGDSHC